MSIWLILTDFPSRRVAVGAAHRDSGSRAGLGRMPIRARAGTGIGRVSVRTDSCPKARMKGFRLPGRQPGRERFR